MAYLQPRNRGLRAAGRATAIMGLLAMSALFSACGGGDDGIACTLEARTSVLLTVVDPFGAALPGVTAAYQIDGGNVQTQACDSNGTCALAYELSGVFAVTATKPGFASASGAVTVTRDECHVKTERLMLTLRPSP